jgi:peptidase E
MKLVLGSAPEGVKDITEKIEELVGKSADQISVAILNEASAVEDGDFRWLINGLLKVSRTFGGNMDLVNLSSLDIKDIKNRLSKADVIWCFGGSTDWLKIVFKKTGFETLLPKLLQTKVWVGSSAGSCIMGKRGLWKTDSKIYSGEKYYDVKEYLGFINAYLYPHCWGKFVSKNAINILMESSKEHKVPIYALSDKSAVIVEDKKIYMIGRKAWKIVKGKIEEKV